jgi:hypothetical protein
MRHCHRCHATFDEVDHMQHRLRSQGRAVTMPLALSYGVRSCIRRLTASAAMLDSLRERAQLNLLCGLGARALVPRASSLVRPAQHGQVPFRSCGRACMHIPRAAVRVRPLQHCQMPSLGCGSARQLIPRAAARARPLKLGQMPSCSRSLGRQLIPRAAVRARPLQHGQMPSLSCGSARQLITRAAARARPLKHGQVPFSSRSLTRA